LKGGVLELLRYHVEKRVGFVGVQERVVVERRAEEPSVSRML